MEFRKYMHIERLGTDQVDGILFGKCFIFPKIDGTNASVYVRDGELKAGSRTRELSIEKDRDNAGFYKKILEEKEKFLAYFEKNPTHRLFGEYLVPHTLKTYRPDTWKEFYVFDVAIDSGEELEYLSYEVYCKYLEDSGIKYISPQKIITNPTPENLAWELENNHYLLPQEEIGEGIVIKNYDFQNRFGRTVFAKIVRQEFKERHYLVMGAPESEQTPIEQKIAEEFVTFSLVEKEKAKIELDYGGWDSKLIPRLLETIYHEVVTEEIWNIVKKYKSPKICFKTLRAFIIREIKKQLPELF